MDLTQGLLIQRLLLPGYRKDYEVVFQPGVNVIYGDADTGKSSILRFIYYLLGGKSIELDEEIASSVKYAVLEILINGSPYSIVRDVFNTSKDIDVYSCKYSNIDKNYPQKFKSSVSNSTEESRSLSDFLLETLGFPLVKLKQAPSKDSSGLSRLSFLDLFKFMYLDQDSVGSAGMLNIGNHFVETKNREVLKYIFSVLDSNISDLESDISRKSTERTSLENKYEAITAFLSETQFESSEDLDSELSSLDDLKESMSEQLSEINLRMTGDSELYECLKDALNTINLNIDKQEDVKRNSIRNVERFTRLLHDYKNDISKIKSSISAAAVIGEEKIESAPCPVCLTVVDFSEISEKFDVVDTGRLKSELNSIARRSRDLQQLIHDNRNDLTQANNLLDSLYLEQNRAKEIMDVELSKAISPYLVERDAIIKEIAKLDERRTKFVHSLKVRNQHRTIGEKIDHLHTSIDRLREKLDQLKKESPSFDDILKTIGGDLNEFIKKVKIKNHFGVGVDSRTFLPVVRDVEYRKINSGGLRTIASIGYLTSLLMQKLEVTTNIPGLLMIDTVGKFLGKTTEDGQSDGDAEKNDADTSDVVADPEKYKNLFDALIDIADKFDEDNKLCQIILVDNDIPQEIAYQNKGYEVAHYRSDGINGLPIGLIDDWDEVKVNRRQSDLES